MAEDLQRTAPVGTTWTPSEPDRPRMAVTLQINVPDHAQVRRHTVTGAIEIDGLTIADLITLRDALTDQIIKLQRNQGNDWTSF